MAALAGVPPAMLGLYCQLLSTLFIAVMALVAKVAGRQYGIPGRWAALSSHVNACLHRGAVSSPPRVANVHACPPAVIPPPGSV